MDAHEMSVANVPGVPTRKRRNQETSPDVVVMHTSRVKKSEWKCLESVGSDHLPMLFYVDLIHEKQSPPPRQKTCKRWDWGKADWGAFNTHIEKAEQKVRGWRDPAECAPRFAKIVMKAAQATIPQITSAAKPRTVRWSKGTRDMLRHRNSEAPEKVADAVYGDKREALRRHVQADAGRNDLASLFRTVKRIDGKHAPNMHHPILQEDKLVTGREKAQALGLHFARVCGGGATVDLGATESTKRPRRAPEEPPNEESANSFTSTELDLAISNLEEGKAPGPDGVTNEMLRKFGPAGKSALLHVINTSWEQGLVPEQWKRGHVVALLKPEKPPQDPTSYRPITLTSCVSKLLESMIVTRMVHLMEADGTGVDPLQDCQAGFRPARSAAEQVANVAAKGKMVKTNGGYCITIFVDYTKAFDTLHHPAVLDSLRRKKFPERYLRWVQSFMEDRKAAVRAEGVLGDYYAYEDGVPQGSVISPLLFTCAVDDVAEAFDDVWHTSMYLFADDTAVAVLGDSLEEALERAQAAIATIETLSAGKKLKVSHSKTEAMLFCSTGARKRLPEKLPQLKLQTGTICWVTEKVYLGVIVDDECTFEAHVTRVRRRLRKRVAALRTLANTEWGNTADILREVYVAYALQVVRYCLEVYGAALSAENVKQLQSDHLTAARIITGCPKTTSAATLLWEAHLPSIHDLIAVSSADLLEKHARLRNETSTDMVSLERGKYCDWLKTARQVTQGLYTERRDRAQLKIARPVHPWLISFDNLKIHPTIPEVSKRNTDTTTLRLRAEEHLRVTYPQATWWVYTDGATDLTRGGAGAVFYKTGEVLPHTKVVENAGRHASAFQAELVAIREALRVLVRLVETGDIVVLCTDSQSALKALEGGPARVREEVMHTIWGLLHSVTTDKEVTLHMQYVPSHVGIDGNEVADRLAQQGQKLRQTEPLTYRGARAAARRMHDHMRPGTHTLYWKDDRLTRPPLRNPTLKRRGEVQLRRLRTGRHSLVWDFLVDKGKEKAPPCTACGEACTVTHLFNCPKLKHEQDSFLHTTDPRRLLFRHPQDVMRYLTAAELLGDAPIHTLINERKP
eukprot:TRINITY_DN8943_c0_g1_i9.p1 TRINITY_DN8943_c0_g1~~TRINITY_DN8943_c0_g1_i9.p1  ORF type:complete len:1081 (+),score=88.71 TRINITY_DN8943_c0_g1_i9:666-3908(+)